MKVKSGQQKFPPRTPKIKLGRVERPSRGEAAHILALSSRVDVSSSPAACTTWIFWNIFKACKDCRLQPKTSVSTHLRRAFSSFTETLLLFEVKSGLCHHWPVCTFINSDRLNFCSRKAEPAAHPFNYVNANQRCYVRTKTAQVQPVSHRPQSVSRNATEL